MQQKLENLIANLKTLFLTGLLTILPITLTFFIFRWFFRILQGWLTPIKNLNPRLFDAFPYSEVIVVLLLILFIGLISKVLILRPIVSFLKEKILFKLPLVKPVYSGIKQLSHALIASHNQIGFHTVVTVEFPSQNVFSLGFLTGELPAELAPKSDTKYYKIYIPNSPNPVTGHFIILPAEKFTISALSRQEAMAIIMSGGVITLDRFK
jgi:uncharacterized membrane protein